MADLATKQTLSEGTVAERDMGKHNNADTGFKALADKAGRRYGSKAAGERVAGAQFQKMRQAGQLESEMDESALQAYIGDKKYGRAGMDALRKAGRDGASKDKMASIRDKYNKMDEADEAHKETKLIRDLRAQGLSDKQIIRKMEQMLRGTTKTVKTVAKEGDMEEGNKFAYNVIKAKAAGLKKADLDGDGDMEPVREADYIGLEEKKAKPDYIDLDRDGDRKESMKKAAVDKKKSRSAGTAFDPEVAKNMITKDPHPRYDVKDTGYSKRFTRKTEEPQDDNDSKDSQADKYASPKKKGRPKGPDRGPERVTKGSTKYKIVGGQRVKKEKTKEDLDSDGVMMTRPSNMSSEDMHNIASVDKGEYDREGDMAKEQLHTIKLAARELASILSDDENLPEWVQSKITKAMDYIDTARDYMISTKADREPMAEKAVSKNQAVAARIARGVQKGTTKAEPGSASAEMAKMGTKPLRKLAKTDTGDLPKKVREESDQEPKAKKAKGGFEFGKGVYEGLDKKFSKALTESMNISVNMNSGANGEPTKSMTVTATDEDAEVLATLLKMAGMDDGQSGMHNEQEVDENAPDYPTNTETSDNAFQYSGGLNGPKSTGQTTVPVIASQLRRQVSMEESVELERSLFRLYQNYKAQ